MAEKFRIRIASMTTDAPFGDNRAGDFAQVVFRVFLQDYRIDVPVYVNTNTIEDGNVVKVARSHFANLMINLAQQTEAWAMTDAEIRALRDAQAPGAI